MAYSDSPRTNWLTGERWLLAGLLVFTLLVRGGVLWSLRDNLTQDPDAYREIAENLLRHGEFALGKGDPAAEGSQVRPTAYRPPLYPVLLSNLPAADGTQISLAKVAGLHLLLGVATVWLTWLTARRLCRVHESAADEMHHGDSSALRPSSRLVHCASLMHPTLAPLLAGLLVACDPILLNQQTLVMTETLAAFLAILALWCLARFDGCRSWFNAALAGGAIGLAVLCRPTFLPWLGLVGLGMLLVHGGPNFKFQKSNLIFPQRPLWLPALGWRVLNLAALGIIFAVVTSPWAIRNYRVFGKPIATTTHGGYTLYLGNNSWFYLYLINDATGLPWEPPSGEVNWWEMYDWKRPFVVRRPNDARPNFETWTDAEYYALAHSEIRAQRRIFLWACLYRLRQLWSPLPHKLTADESTGRRLLRYATALWYCGVYLLAAIGVWRLRWKLLAPPWIWGVLLCLAFTAVHTFYWTNLRMRAPLMPFVAIVAAAGLTSSRFKVQGLKLNVE